MDHHMMTRRRLLQVSASGLVTTTILGGALTAPTAAEAKPYASPFTWISPRGTIEVMDDYPYWVAKEMGYFGDLGVETAMEPGPSDGTAVVKFLAVEQADIGFPSPGVLSFAINNGMDLVSVFGSGFLDLFNIAFRKGEGMADLKGLEGKTVLLGSAAWQAIADLAALKTATKDHTDAVQKDKDATAKLKEEIDALAEVEQAHKDAVAAHEAAEARFKRAVDLLGRVQARAAAVTANERRSELQDRIAKAGVARQAVETATAEASVGPDNAEIDRLRVLTAALTTARALRDSTATRVTMRYTPGREGAVRDGDAQLEHDQVHPVHKDTILHFDGLGALTIYPGEGPEGLADVAHAERDLVKALSGFGHTSMEDALHAHRKRQEASERLTGVQAELAAFAPKGIEDLQRQFAALPVAMPDDHADLPEADEAEAEQQAANGQAAELAATREAVRERRETARTKRAEATIRQEAAAERLEMAIAAIERLASRDDAELAALTKKADASREQAEVQLRDIRDTALDIAATEATLKRVQSVVDAARDRIDALRPIIAALSERISGNAGEAVEEQLQEADEKLEVSREHLARVEREVKVLLRLQGALDGARSEARDRYFEPIATELRPLMHLLWPDAELNWADDSLLPQSLTRNGQVESVDVLSGGTQEQIAFLVRLAFARLLAKGGRHAPVILDDALVYTDDDRIEKMFDALHRQAGDLQIIVLSCRQRAFRELGGKALQINTGVR